MPYASEAQRKYFNANRERLEAQGVDVDEWNESSRGKKLPKKVKKNAMYLLGFMMSKTAAMRFGNAHRQFLREGFVPRELAKASDKLPVIYKSNPGMAKEVNDLMAQLYKIRSERGAARAGMLPLGRGRTKSPPPPSLWARLFGGFNKTASFNDLGRALAAL